MLFKSLGSALIVAAALAASPALAGKHDGKCNNVSAKKTKQVAKCQEWCAKEGGQWQEMAAKKGRWHCQKDGAMDDGHGHDHSHGNAAPAAGEATEQAPPAP